MKAPVVTVITPALLHRCNEGKGKEQMGMGQLLSGQEHVCGNTVHTPSCFAHYWYHVRVKAAKETTA